MGGLWWRHLGASRRHMALVHLSVRWLRVRQRLLLLRPGCPLESSTHLVVQRDGHSRLRELVGIPLHTGAPLRYPGRRLLLALPAYAAGHLCRLLRSRRRLFGDQRRSVLAQRPAVASALLLPAGHHPHHLASRHWNHAALGRAAGPLRCPIRWRAPRPSTHPPAARLRHSDAVGRNGAHPDAAFGLRRALPNGAGGSAHLAGLSGVPAAHLRGRVSPARPAAVRRAHRDTGGWGLPPRPVERHATAAG
mmetsp:Transcript_8804/g.29042  ORF Transcript_8804/g.29042 Transcript_8804/m.29042 type:complete len:249 (-) Transcript_8804:901-1647(-)